MYIEEPSLELVQTAVKALHPWRSSDDNNYLRDLNFCIRHIPFCTTCADWHYSTEAHSMITVDGIEPDDDPDVLITDEYRKSIADLVPVVLFRNDMYYIPCIGGPMGPYPSETVARIAAKENI